MTVRMFWKEILSTWILSKHFLRTKINVICFTNDLIISFDVIVLYRISNLTMVAAMLALNFLLIYVTPQIKEILRRIKNQNQVAQT